ncbi:MAG: hydrolase [Planctomycetes bacterium]|nr:hydrolase [Planctomycetota bacterium]
MISSESSLAAIDDSVLLVVDLQEKLFPLMQEQDVLLARVQMLMRAAETLDLPILVTEQYPSGLGRTLRALDGIGRQRRLEKTTFSCFGDEGVVAALRETRRRRLVLCGIEAHICVMQTALEALDAGWEVQVVEDAVASRLPHAAALGIARMRQAGAVTASAEGQIFEWLRRCDRPEFKSLLPLFKESR